MTAVGSLVVLNYRTNTDYHITMICIGGGEEELFRKDSLVSCPPTSENPEASSKKPEAKGNVKNRRFSFPRQPRADLLIIYARNGLKGNCFIIIRNQNKIKITH